MYALHQLVKVCPDTIKIDSELYKTLKLRYKHLSNLYVYLFMQFYFSRIYFCRLHYLACNIQGYIKPLREDIRSKNNPDQKASTDGKMKILALKTATNISNMIKDFFHNPPRCKAEIPLSGKIPTFTEAVNPCSVV